MRKPWRENPELDRKSQVRQVPKYYRAMLIELLDEPMAREKVLKYLDRFQYDTLIAGSGEKPEGNAQAIYEKDTAHLEETKEQLEKRFSDLFCGYTPTVIKLAGIGYSPQDTADLDKYLDTTDG